MERYRVLGGIGAAGALIGVLALALEWLPRPAAAQLGGHAQVTRLELGYLPGSDEVEARFHLASGLAVTDRTSSEAAADRLFQAAQVLAAGKARLFASVRNDRIVSWHLSVP